MKKIIATIALAGLATLSFGQSLVLNGYLDTGATVLANGSDKAVLGLWGDDAKVNGGRFKLLGKFDYADSGVSFETRWDNLIGSATVGTVNPVYFKHAYVWAQFFNKMVYTQVGMIKEESTKTGGDKNFKYATETAGAVVVVKPVPELALQVAAFPASLSVVAYKAKNGSTTKTVNNYMSKTTTIDGVSSVYDTITAYSAAYTLKGVARAAAGVKFLNNSGNYVPNAAYAGVNLYAVPNLTATVEGGVENLSLASDVALYTISQKFSYNFKDLGLAPLTANLVAYQYVYGADYRVNDDSTTINVSQDPAFRFQPSVSYALEGGITPTLGFAYQTGAAAIFNDGYSLDLGKTVGVPVLTKTNPNKVASFEVKPSVALTLAKSQTLTFMYAYTMSVGEDKLGFLTKGSDSMHTVQANYTYSF